MAKLTNATQLIVNEYTPGQGISAHTDAKIFGDNIITLSLGSHCGFVFTKIYFTHCRVCDS